MPKGSKIKFSPSKNTKVHSQLQSSNVAINQEVKPTLSPSLLDAAKDPKANSLTVNIEFKLSKPSKNSGSTISLPIKIPGDDYFSMQNSYNHYSDQSKDASAKSLQTRHDCGFSNIHTLATQTNGPEYYKGTTTYNTKFHHSEQAFYEYITQRSNLDDVITKLAEHGLQEQTSVEKVTIYMHSIRYVCGNCEIGALGLTNNNYFFRDVLSKSLTDKGLIIPGDNININIEVSADKPDGTNKPVKKTQHQEIGEAILVSEIIEFDTKAYPLSKTTTDLHNRSCFISSEVSSNNNYLRAYQAIEKIEYLEMITNGENIKEHAAVNNYFRYYNESQYTKEEINLIEDGFVALALIPSINNTRNNLTKAQEVMECRKKIAKEIKEEHDKLETIKYKLREKGTEEAIVAKLSKKFLEKISVFMQKDLLTYRDLEQIVKAKDVNNEFVKRALKNRLDKGVFNDVLENEDIVLFIFKSTNNFDEFCEFITSNADQCELLLQLVNDFNLDIAEIIRLYNDSQEAFDECTTDDAISFLENNDEINLEALIEIYKNNEELFHDLINDRDGLLENMELQEFIDRYKQAQDDIEKIPDDDCYKIDCDPYEFVKNQYAKDEYGESDDGYTSEEESDNQSDSNNYNDSGSDDESDYDNDSDSESSLSDSDSDDQSLAGCFGELSFSDDCYYN